MRTLLILGGLGVAAIAGGVQLWATLRASEARAATAAEWSSDDAQFVAGGAHQHDAAGCYARPTGCCRLRCTN